MSLTKLMQSSSCLMENGAFEIKLGANQIEKAAKDLVAIKNFMEADPYAKAPDILCVICGLANFAYTREDGVMVVPIAALKQ